MHPKFLCILWVSALAAPVGAQTSLTTLEAESASRIDSTTQTQDVRFKDDDHERMTVAVRLAGSGPYRFLVDTGADRTAISRELATKLKFADGPRARLHSITGASAVQTATVPSLQLNHKQISGFDAPLLESVNMGADGILGADSLRSQRIVFDFNSRTLSIVPSASRVDVDAEGTIVVRARQRNGRLLISRAAADDQPLSVVIDTGSEVSIGNEALRRRLMGRQMLERSGKVELLSVTGETIVGDYMILKTLEMGGITLRNLAIVFAEVHTFRQLHLDDRPALLMGMNAMRAFNKFSIDFANKKLRVMMPTHGSLDQAQMANRAAARLSPGW